MSLPEKRGSTGSLWILCMVCMILAGICFDNVQAGSWLAYQNTGEAADASGVFASSGGETAKPSAVCTARRGIQTGQAYVSEISLQGGYAVLPRKTTQRTNSRSAVAGMFIMLLGGVFFTAFFVRQTVFFSDGLSQIVSNTVILHYIHGQDGEKA